jgi:hypothetical protein
METKFCHSCGNKIPKYSVFCASCGAKQHLSSSENIEKQDDSIPVEILTEKHTDFKKPFYKKTWFIILMVLWVLFIIGKQMGPGPNAPMSQIDNDTFICCNCGGKGKINSFNTTTTCKYCYGNGDISKATYEARCK